MSFVGIAAVAAVAAQPALADRSVKLPPGGVYTCAWIGAHPAEAAAASVSCSPQAPPIVAGASETTSILVNPLLPDQNGVCGQIPHGGGRVGKGVWAWTPEYHYSNYWDIGGIFSPSYYTWYIQKVDGTNVFNQTVTDIAIHSHSLASNNYRGGAQNHSATAQSWGICYVNPG